MAESKHTTWHVDRAEGTKIKDADGNTVLWTQHTHLHGRRTDEEVTAIANLAAAAPELLEALAWFVSDIDGTHTSMVEFEANLERARAALAKAECAKPLSEVA